MHCVPFDMRLVSSFHSEKCYYICEISYFLLFFLNTYSRTWWPIFPTLHVPLYIYHSVYSEMDKEPQFHTSCPLSHFLAGWESQSSSLFAVYDTSFQSYCAPEPFWGGLRHAFKKKMCQISALPCINYVIQFT